MQMKKKLLDLVRDKIRFEHYKCSWGVQALRAEERKHIPVVLTKDEVKR